MNNPIEALKKIFDKIVEFILNYIHLLLWVIPALWGLMLSIYILDVEFPILSSLLEGALNVLYTWTALPQFWPVYLLVWVEVGQFFLFRKSRQYQSRRLTPLRWIYLMGIVYYVAIGIAGFRELALWTAYPLGGIVMTLLMLGFIIWLIISLGELSHRHIRWMVTLSVLFTVSCCLYTWFFTLRPVGLGSTAVVNWLWAGTVTRFILLWTIFRLLETVFVYFRIWLTKPFLWRSVRAVVGDAVGNPDWREEEKERNSKNNSNSVNGNSSNKTLRVYDYLWKIEPESRFRQLAAAYTANRSHSALLAIFLSGKEIELEKARKYFNTLVNLCYLETGILGGNGNFNRWNQWVTRGYLHRWSQQLSRLTGDDQSFFLEVPGALGYGNRNAGGVDGLFRRLRRNDDNRLELLSIYADLYNTMVESDDPEANQFMAFHFFSHLPDDEEVLKLRVAEELGAVCLLNEDVNRRVAVLYKNKSNRKTVDLKHLKKRYHNLQVFHEKQASFFLYSNKLGFRWIPGIREPVNPGIPGQSSATNDLQYYRGEAS